MNGFVKLKWKTYFMAGLSIFLLYLCISYWKNVAGLIAGVIGAASPLVIGGVIAYIINILMANYERHYFPGNFKPVVVRSRRIVCMLLAIVTLLAIITLIVWLVLPQLWSGVQLIISELPDFLREIVLEIEEWGILPENIMDALASIDWQSRISQIIQMVTSGIGSVMDIVIKAVTSIFSGLITAFLSIIFAVYLLIDKERLGRQFHRVVGHYLKESWYEKFTYVLGVVNDCFHNFIVGQCTEAVILGVLCSLGMLIFRLPYAPMVGALVAFTSLVPIAGAYIGCAVGAFMILTVSPIKALIFVIFLVILQQLEGNLIYPRVVGASIGLPGIWVLAAITIGGGVMGIGGMLIGVPLTAAIYRLVRDDVNKGRKKKVISPKIETEPVKEETK